MITTVAQKVLGTLKISYQGTEIDLASPWKRLPMVDAVKQYTGVDFNSVSTDEDARALAASVGVPCEKTDSWGKALANDI